MGKPNVGNWEEKFFKGPTKVLPICLIRWEQLQVKYFIPQLLITISSRE